MRMNRTGMNMERVKRQNRSLILNYINSTGPVSRKDIAAATGLTAAAVTQISAALISEGVLTVKGTSTERSGEAGRRKVLLDIDPEVSLAYTVNIEPDITTVAVCGVKGFAVLSDDGEPIVKSIPTDKESSPAYYLGQIASYCHELSKSVPDRLRDRIECVSVGITGIVDLENGISKHAYGIWNEEVDVRAILKKCLGLPVLVENNVDAFSTGELLFGAGQDNIDFLTVKWGPGVGSTVIVDGDVFRGKHGKTAEFGHFIVDPNGELCSCGRRGCLETRLSVRALGPLLPPSKKTEKQIDEAIDLFARSIVNAGTITAPGRIVLFGRLAGDPVLRGKLIKACKAYDPSYDENRITYTSLSDRESFVGPAAVCANARLFSD